MNYFIAGIGTDSGKTLISALMCQALNADYWKPVQSGIPGDTEEVKRLAGNHDKVFHPETYRLRKAASPHDSAKAENMVIDMNKFSVPYRAGIDLVIEGAGGLLVPLNQTHCMIDLLPSFKCCVILVSNAYLGSINHTLLSCEALRSRRIPVLGIIFNRYANQESENAILRISGLRLLLKVPELSEITPDSLKPYSLQLKRNLHNEIID